LFYIRHGVDNKIRSPAVLKRPLWRQNTIGQAKILKPPSIEGGHSVSHSCTRTTKSDQTPEPTVFFVSHGASSLDFEIRSFVATPAHRLPVTHALNTSINKSLEANNIEIPFPQSVVHMRKKSETR